MALTDAQKQAQWEKIRADFDAGKITADAYKKGHFALYGESERTRCKADLVIASKGLDSKADNSPEWKDFNAKFALCEPLSDKPDKTTRNILIFAGIAIGLTLLVFIGIKMSKPTPDNPSK
jgi:hypothetical protein